VLAQHFLQHNVAPDFFGALVEPSMAHDFNATLSIDALAQEYVGPYMEIYFQKITTWQLHHVIAFAVVITAGAELFTQLIHTVLCRNSPTYEPEDAP